MQPIDTILGTVRRAALETLTGLGAGFTESEEREAAVAYAEVTEPEDLGEAEHRAAIIRERIRRQGLRR